MKKIQNNKLILLRDIIMRNIIIYLELLGKSTIIFLISLGSIVLFSGTVLRSMVTPPFYYKLFFAQLKKIGFDSLTVIGLTACFTGAVLALQSYIGFSRMNAEGAVASVVVLSITRELGPVIVGLMLAGRLGASIAAELATMRVTEQIDALYTLNVNPINYLIVPRVWAGIVSMPFLVFVADIIGVFGGYITGVYRLGFSPFVYVKKTFEFLEVIDVCSGLIKAVIFGFIICLIGCYNGYNANRGAVGVGYAATNAVVNSSITVLLMNYFVTGWFFA